jgi:hypothetical protein
MAKVTHGATVAVYNQLNVAAFTGAVNRLHRAEDGDQYRGAIRAVICEVLDAAGEANLAWFREEGQTGISVRGSAVAGGR